MVRRTGTRPMFIGRKQKFVHQPNWKYYLGILPKHVWKMAEFKAKQNLFYTVALDPLNPVYKSIRVILRKISPFFGYKLNYPIWGKFWNILVIIIPSNYWVINKSEIQWLRCKASSIVFLSFCYSGSMLIEAVVDFYTILPSIFSRIPTYFC